MLGEYTRRRPADGLTCGAAPLGEEVLPMVLITAAFDVAAGLLKVLGALIELEVAKRRRREDLAKARRPRHLR
jgi:hypothetical protein